MSINFSDCSNAQAQSLISPTADIHNIQSISNILVNTTITTLEPTICTIDTPTVSNAVTSTLNTVSLHASATQCDVITAQTLAVTDIHTDHAETQTLLTESITCNTLDVQDLVCPNYIVATVFADQINAAQQVNVTSHVVDQQKAKSGISKGLKIGLIILGILLIIAAVALVVCTFGASFIAYTVGYVSTSAAIIGASTLICSVGANVAVLVAAGIVVGIGVGTIVAGAILPVPQPLLKTSLINAVYGRSFLSDCIFGTTSYSDATKGYISYLLLQNENHSSYALPRIIGYNPQLGYFDDYSDYDNVQAYLSICTQATNLPNITLRFNANGNLAIYDAPRTAPLWSSGTQVSSIKYKENIQPIKDPLTRLQQIQGVHFNYINKPRQELGLIAQNVLQVFECAVEGSEETLYRLRLEKMVPLILESMKELYYQQERALQDLLLKK